VCLILLGWKSHPDYALVLVANRDEYHARPSLPAGQWPDHPEVTGGRDQQGGGTWLGLTRQGRFAAVTNYRDPSQFEARKQSRGLLTRSYLVGHESPHDYLASLKPHVSLYNDFNLLAGDRNHLFCLESRTQALIPLQPGVYGLSNHLLDTPWPKVADGKAHLSSLLDHTARGADQQQLSDSLMDLVADRTPYPDDRLPETGIPLERERLISAAFICDPVYGTRCTTVILVRPDGRGWLAERRFSADGSVAGECGIML
jgi:uncharacterized protein with NRDE domain